MGSLRALWDQYKRKILLVFNLRLVKLKHGDGLFRNYAGALLASALGLKDGDFVTELVHLLPDGRVKLRRRKCGQKFFGQELEDLEGHRSLSPNVGQSDEQRQADVQDGGCECLVDVDVGDVDLRELDSDRSSRFAEERREKLLEPASVKLRRK